MKNDSEVEFEIVDGKFKKMMFSNDGKYWKMMYFVGIDKFRSSGPFVVKKDKPIYFALSESCFGYGIGFNAVVPFLMCKEVGCDNEN